MFILETKLLQASDEVLKMGLLARARIVRDGATLSELIKERDRFFERFGSFGLFASSGEGFNLLNRRASSGLFLVVLFASELIGFVAFDLRFDVSHIF